MIASQLEPFFNEQLALRTGMRVMSVPRGLPQALPPEVEIFVAAPICGGLGVCRPEEVEQPPAGWPFNLKWVQLVSSGVDAYPPWFLRTLPVSTARGVAAESIAEYVMAVIFNHAKRLPDLWVHHPDEWRLQPLKPVRGSVLGLAGFGAIAQAVAKRALALGMTVKAVRRQVVTSPIDGVAFVSSIDELLACSDHLVLAVPATPQTRHWLNHRNLALAKPGLHLINVGRGELIDTEALLHALNNESVGWATLDTTDPEPLPAGHPLYSHPRANISPHTSAIGPEARLALVEKFIQNMQRFAHGEPLLDQVT